MSQSMSPDTKLNELFNVVLHASAAVVREYLQQNARTLNIEVQNEKGDTALLLAARRGDIEVVRALLEQPVSANVHTRNHKGSNALIAGAMKGNTDICQLLLDHGADVNQSTDSSDTALSLAIWQNHTDVCILLIKAGAEVDNIDRFGDSMLLDASKHGNVAVMELLLEKQTLHIDHCNKKGHCLEWNTQVARVDGKAVSVQDIRTGDVLVGLDGADAVVEAVDRNQTSHSLIQIDSPAGSYRVTPNHTLMLRWNRDPVIRVIASGSESNDCELELIYYERATCRRRKLSWPCTPIDKQNVKRRKPTAASTSLPSHPTSHLPATPLLHIPHATANSPLSLSDLSCSQLESHCRDWLDRASSAGHLAPLHAGDLIEMTAEVLYKERNKLLRLDDVTKQLVSGRLVPLRGSKQQQPFSCLAQSLDSTPITTISLHTYATPIRTVDIQVRGSMYALANGILTHNSALINTAWKGELPAMSLLLDRGADPMIITKTGASALIMAAQHNHRTCVHELIQRETSPIDQVDETGRSAFAHLTLFTPAVPGSEEPYWRGMEMLLERHASIETPPNIGNLLLCRAANINQITLASLLLAQGADINYCDPNNKERPPLLAHLQGAPSLPCTKFLIANHAKVDQQDVDGHTALMFAIKHNSPEITAFLLESGASTMIENRLGETAMSMCRQTLAASQLQVQQLQNLPILEDPQHASSPLTVHQAALERAQKCLALLIERAAREMGTGALLLQAAQHGELDKLEQYLTYGIENDPKYASAAAANTTTNLTGERENKSASVSENSASGVSPTAEMIDVNFTDKLGRSALMLAAKYNHLGCVKYLLHSGALINLRDKDGFTALTLAIRAGARESAELLAETLQGLTLARGAFHFLSSTQTTSSSPSSVHSHRTLASGAPGEALNFNDRSMSIQPSAQVFGLAASPQQMAQEEFDVSTNFLVQVTDQLRSYLLHGKQAALDARKISSGPDTVNSATAATNATRSTSTHDGESASLKPPLARSSTSYFNSFPSPAIHAAAGGANAAGGVTSIDNIPAAANSSSATSQSGRSHRRTLSHSALRSSGGEAAIAHLQQLALVMANEARVKKETPTIQEAKQEEEPSKLDTSRTV